VTEGEHEHRGAGPVSVARRWLDPEPDLGIRAELVRQTNRGILLSSLGTPPTVGLLVLLLWDDVHRRGLLIWAATTIALGAVQVVADAAMLRRDLTADAASLRRWLQLRCWVLLAGGFAWASLPLAARPSQGDEAALSLQLVFVIAVMATNTIFSAPSRRLFVSFQLPVAVTASIGFATFGTAFGLGLGVVVLYAAAFSFALHWVSHGSALAAVRNASKSRGLARQLADEREMLELANHDLVDLNRRLAHQAAHDALTDLPNREVFRAQLDHALVDASTRGRTVAVLFLDVDRFKDVNDSLGHAAGDRLLRIVASRIRGRLRSDAILARLGGDEFTVLIPDLDDLDGAHRVAEGIRDVMRDRVSLGSRSVRVSVSIGIAANTGVDDTADDLLRHADAAMYRAKAEGRDRAAIFDDSLRAWLSSRLDDQEAARSALTGGSIVPWFQPEIDLRTGEIVGAEALARWHHPTRGLLNAGSFVPVLEEMGLVDALGAAMSTHVVAALAAHDAVLPGGFRMRLNVAASMLMDPDALDGGLAHVRRKGVDPSRIAIEVTETAIIRDIGAARAWLQRARDAGMTVSLDDFGTGYSSLSLLTELPLDGVKLDLSFVRQMSVDPTARTVVEAVARLAHRIGLDVVAEGVEHQHQADTLLELGVTRAQGYLWSPAVPLDELTGWLHGGAPWQQGTAARDASTLGEERLVVARQHERDLLPER
jgi:diguanylate cyclase (GGDEF)-like protein